MLYSFAIQAYKQTEAEYITLQSYETIDCSIHCLIRDNSPQFISGDSILNRPFCIL